MDAAAWDERYAARPLVWSAGPNQFVEREAGDLPPGTALDLACGEGRNARWLAERGWRVVAMDFSAVAVDKGRRGDPAGAVDWRVGDALTSPLPTDLDLVVLAYLQLPAVERRVVLRRCFDSLAPGGTLLVVAHDSTNLTEGTGGPQDAAVLFTAEDVLGDLVDRGGEVVRAGRFPRRVAAEQPDGHGSEAGRTAWDAVVRLVRPG